MTSRRIRHLLAAASIVLVACAEDSATLVNIDTCERDILAASLSSPEWPDRQRLLDVNNNDPKVKLERVMAVMMAREQAKLGKRSIALDSISDSIMKIPGIASGINRIDNLVSLANVRRSGRSNVLESGSMYTMADSVAVVAAMMDLDDIAVGPDSYPQRMTQLYNTSASIASQYPADTAFGKLVHDYATVVGDSTFIFYDGTFLQMWLDSAYVPQLSQVRGECGGVTSWPREPSSAEACPWCYLARLIVGGAGIGVLQWFVEGLGPDGPDGTIVEAAAIGAKWGVITGIGGPVYTYYAAQAKWGVYYYLRVYGAHIDELAKLLP